MMLPRNIRPVVLVPGLLVLAAVVWFRCVPDSWRVAVHGSPRLPRGCLTLEGHRCWVTALAFSPDGSLLASGGHYGDARGEVRVWDLAAGRPVFVLSPSPQAVYSLAFSRDARTLMTGEPDATVGLWDVATGRPEGRLVGRGGEVGRLATTPRGGLIAFAEAPDGDRESIPPAARGSDVRWYRGGWPMAVSADGGVTAAGAEGGRAVILRTAAAEYQIPNPAAGSVTALAFTPDARVLVIGGHDGSVELWDVATLGRVARARFHGSVVNAAAVTPDGRVLATASNDRTVGLWNAATLEPLAVLTGPEFAVYSVAFSPDGRRLAAGSYDRTVRVWDTSGLTR
jgi:WD40 repeat protein